MVEDQQNCHLVCDPKLKERRSKFEFEGVKEEDVLELLKGLDPNKACGADVYWSEASQNGGPWHMQ